LETLVAAATETDRVLVLVQLGGGNDGINTVIPLDQDSVYASVRPNIYIPLNTVLRLNSSTGSPLPAGLHPSMDGRFTVGGVSVPPNGGMKLLFDDGKLTIVQGVSYPNPNLSHFRATDIWLTASDYNVELNTGWLGRYLDREFPGYGTPQFDDQVMPDPLAIQIGSVVSFGLQGSARSMGVAIQSPETFFQLVNQGSGGVIDTAPQTPAGRELEYIRSVAVQSQEYAAQIKRAADLAPRNLSTLYPPDGRNSLADQLRVVARLIAGGLKTRVYVVNLGGFDNHSAQVDTTDKTLGIHASLLGRLANALMAFQDDIRLFGVENRVLGMTFSEFGRRVASNASFGTDHGTAAPMFLFGSPVRAGIVGENPKLDAPNLVNGNLKMQYDFRDVYASVLSQWFGVSSAELNAVLSKASGAINPNLPLIRPGIAVSAEQQSTLPTDYQLYANYPNPFNPSTTIAYDLPHDATVSLKVYDVMGREVATLVQEYQPAGRHRVQFHPNGLASGAYIYQIQAGSFTDRKRMLYVK
jgi:uncharacterized protein (DUF1501 family)